MIFGMSTSFTSINDNAFEQYRKTCSIIFGNTISSQLRYIQAFIELQQTLLTSCDSLVANQLGWLEKYVKENEGSTLATEVFLRIYTAMVNAWMNWISTSYDSGTLNIESYAKALDIVNKSFSAP